MKRIYSVLVALCTVSICAAQMHKGESLINVGMGLAPGIGVNASYDYGLIDTWGPGLFTVGGFVGLQTWSDKETIILYTENYSAKQTAFAVRATYRYPINEQFEVFGAALSGFYIESYSFKNKNLKKDNETNALFSVYAGCRYSFSPNVAVFAEVGSGLYWLNGGLCFNF